MKLYLGLVVLAMTLLGALLVQANVDLEERIDSEENMDTGKVDSENTQKTCAPTSTINEKPTCGPQTCGNQCGGSCQVQQCGCS